jgi:hypothetical protein
MILTLNPLLQTCNKPEIQNKVFEVFSRLYDKGVAFTWTPDHGPDTSAIGLFAVAVIIPAKKSKDPMKAPPRHTLKGTISFDRTIGTIDINTGYLTHIRARTLFNKMFSDVCRELGLTK